jgi:hypothetical protein
MGSFALGSLPIESIRSYIGIHKNSTRGILGVGVATLVAHVARRRRLSAARGRGCGGRGCGGRGCGGCGRDGRRRGHGGRRRCCGGPCRCRTVCAGRPGSRCGRGGRGCLCGEMLGLGQGLGLDISFCLGQNLGPGQLGCGGLRRRAPGHCHDLWGCVRLWRLCCHAGLGCAPLWHRLIGWVCGRWCPCCGSCGSGERQLLLLLLQGCDRVERGAGLFFDAAAETLAAAAAQSQHGPRPRRLRWPGLGLGQGAGHGTQARRRLVGVPVPVAQGRRCRPRCNRTRKYGHARAGARARARATGSARAFPPPSGPARPGECACPCCMAAFSASGSRANLSPCFRRMRARRARTTPQRGPSPQPAASTRGLSPRRAVSGPCAASRGGDSR